MPICKAGNVLSLPSHGQKFQLENTWGRSWLMQLVHKLLRAAKSIALCHAGFFYGCANLPATLIKMYSITVYQGSDRSSMNVKSEQSSGSSSEARNPAWPHALGHSCHNTHTSNRFLFLLCTAFSRLFTCTQRIPKAVTTLLAAAQLHRESTSAEPKLHF